MRLIEKLDMRWNESGTFKTRWGLFLCSYCNRKVEKRITNGLNCKSCGCAQREIQSKTQAVHGQAPR